MWGADAGRRRDASRWGDDEWRCRGALVGGRGIFCHHRPTNLSRVGSWDSWGGAETGWEGRVDGRAPLVVLVGEDGRQLVRERLAGARAERLGETRDLPRERLAELNHAHALHGCCSLGAEGKRQLRIRRALQRQPEEKSSRSASAHARRAVVRSGGVVALVRRAPRAVRTTDARVDERGRKPHRSGEGLTAGPIIGDGNAGGNRPRQIRDVKSWRSSIDEVARSGSATPALGSDMMSVDGHCPRRATAPSTIGRSPCRAAPSRAGRASSPARASTRARRARVAPSPTSARSVARLVAVARRAHASTRAPPTRRGTPPRRRAPARSSATCSPPALR